MSSMDRGRANSLTEPRIAAIVVYFRTPELLTSSLDGLRRQTVRPTEIVVVDNSSTVDRNDQRPASGSDWKWIRAERNLGFGAACNLGAQSSDSEYLLFLNADVSLCRDACEHLYAAAKADSRLAVVGPRLYGADGDIELSARAFPTVATGLLGRSSYLTKALGRLNRLPTGLSAALESRGLVDWVSGACMFVRRRAFDEVGGFDEDYWMYWEDADFCRRLKDRGWRTELCTKARADHRTGGSGRSEGTIRAFHSSAARYYARHVARTATMAGLTRWILQVRMRWVLLRHARR